MWQLVLEVLAKKKKEKKQPNIGKDYGCSGKEVSLWGVSQTQDPNS